MLRLTNRPEQHAARLALNGSVAPATIVLVASRARWEVLDGVAAEVRVIEYRATQDAKQNILKLYRLPDKL